jgi:colanic acid/amylovoran biosynthesis glycosyltransferase
MNNKMHLGLYLFALPSFSETFLINKINGLSELGFNISLFITKRNQNKNVFHNSVNVYYQTNSKSLLTYTFILLRTIISNPYNVIRFIILEKKIDRKFISILKNIVINSNVLRLNNIDWLHFEFATLAINRENIGKSIDAKVACSFRGYDISLFPYKNNGCYDVLFNILDKVHTISDDLYNQGLKFGLKKEISYMKITPAIDVNIFKPKSINVNIHNPIRILTVGRLTWKKGYDYAFDALKILNDAGISFEYKVAGDGEYFQKLVCSVDMLGLNEKISFLGSQSQKNIKKEMEWADIYIQPSIQEGFCNAVIEAQSMGLMVIVTDAEGLSENVSNNQTGWVVPRRNPDSIAAKIIDIMKFTDKEINVIRQNASRKVESEFNLIKQIDSFVKFYELK